MSVIAGSVALTDFGAFGSVLYGNRKLNNLRKPFAKIVRLIFYETCQRERREVKEHRKGG